MDERRPARETDINGQDPAGHHFYEFMLLVRKTAAEYLALLVNEIQQRKQLNHIVLKEFEHILDLGWWKEYQAKIKAAHAIGVAPRPATPNMDLLNEEFGAVAHSLSTVGTPSLSHQHHPKHIFRLPLYVLSDISIISLTHHRPCDTSSPRSTFYTRRLRDKASHNPTPTARRSYAISTQSLTISRSHSRMS